MIDTNETYKSSDILLTNVDKVVNLAKLSRVAVFVGGHQLSVAFHMPKAKIRLSVEANSGAFRIITLLELFLILCDIHVPFLYITNTLHNGNFPRKFPVELMLLRSSKCEWESLLTSCFGHLIEVLLHDDRFVLDIEVTGDVNDRYRVVCQQLHVLGEQVGTR